MLRLQVLFLLLLKSSGVFSLKEGHEGYWLLTICSVLGDFKDPGIVPCLAKGYIYAGRFVDLTWAYSVGAGSEPEVTCKCLLDGSALGLGVKLLLRVLMPWLLLLLVGPRIGGFLLISEFFLNFELAVGLRRSLFRWVCFFRHKLVQDLFGCV